MADKQDQDVTIRIRIGDAEIEVTGPHKYVDAKVREFIEQRTWAAGSTGSPAPAGQVPGPGTVAPAKAQSVAEFFKRASPETDLDRALVAAYYLEKLQGHESFTMPEVRETIREGKRTPPKNPSDAIAKNIRKGLIMGAGQKEGKRAYVLTTDGEEAIEELVSQ